MWNSTETATSIHGSTVSCLNQSQTIDHSTGRTMHHEWLLYPLHIRSCACLTHLLYLSNIAWIHYSRTKTQMCDVNILCIFTYISLYCPYQTLFVHLDSWGEHGVVSLQCCSPFSQSTHHLPSLPVGSIVVLGTKHVYTTGGQAFFRCWYIYIYICFCYHAVSVCLYAGRSVRVWD